MSRIKLTAQHIYYVIVVASKDLQFFQFLNDCVTPECFSTNPILAQGQLELYLSTVWHTLKDYYSRHHQLPDETVLRIELMSRATASAEQEITTEFIEEFLDQYRNATINISAAQEYAIIWLSHRKVLPRINDHAERDILTLNEALDRAIRELHHYNHITINEQSIFDILQQNTIQQPVLPTGVHFVDELVNGGIGFKEVAVLLGATGAGKTTLAVQILCSAARLAYRQNPEHYKKMVLFSYEDDEKRLAQRVFCYSVQIPRSRFKQLQSLDDLSDARNPQPYELERFQGELAGFIGERERLETVRDWVSNAVRTVDFSGMSGRPDTGCRGIPEITRYLEQLNSEIGLVIIDWAGIMVRRYLEYRNERDVESAKIRRLQALCDDAYRYIAEPFNCPVLIIHQLSGQANKSPPTAQFSHADAEGCKTFAVNAWHAFVMGPRDNQTNIVKFVCTKTRSGKLQDYRLLQLDDEFCCFHDVTRDYIIDSATKKIIAKEAIQESRPRRRRNNLNSLEF